MVAPKASRSLTTLLVLLISLAVLPLGLISLYQTQSVIGETRELTRSALMADTIQAASAESELVQEALGAARGLAAATRYLDTEGCTSTMAEFIEGQSQFLFAGFVEQDGMMRCSSSRTTLDFSGSEVFNDAMSAGVPRVTVNQNGRVSKQPVLIVSQPVYRDARLVGFVSLSTALKLSSFEPDGRASRDLTDLVAINREGLILAQQDRAEALRTLLPEDRSPADLFAAAGQKIGARSLAGEERVYAISPIVADTFVVVGSWRDGPSSLTSVAANRGLALAFPILMWLASVVVAAYAAQRLVVRHVRRLQSAMRQFALGNRETAPAMDDYAPEELRDAERSFNRMALVLGEAEDKARQDLEDKEVLLREVHHRVKNNLQFIASIMNIQSRKAQSAEAKAVLSGLQRRVKGLATMHRSLYSSTEMGQLDAAELIGSLVADLNDIAGGAGGDDFDIATDLTPALIYPDQAAPLAMLMAEGLTNALKHLGAAPGKRPHVLVKFETLEGGRARLTLENSRSDETVTDETAETGGLGIRLMSAFVDQLEGKAEVEENDDLFVYRVAFPLRAFDPAALSSPALVKRA